MWQLAAKEASEEGEGGPVEEKCRKQTLQIVNRLPMTAQAAPGRRKDVESELRDGKAIEERCIEIYIMMIPSKFWETDIMGYRPNLQLDWPKPPLL